MELVPLPSLTRACGGFLSGTQFSNFYFALLNYTDTTFPLHSPFVIFEDFVIIRLHMHFVIAYPYVFLLFYSRIHRITRMNEGATLI